VHIMAAQLPLHAILALLKRTYKVCVQQRPKHFIPLGESPEDL
jgi:hypothetical protein